MITFITGPQASGKTTLAQQLVRYRKAQWFEGNNFKWNHLDEYADIVVIEGCLFSDVSNKLEEFLSAEVKYQRPYAAHQTHRKVPDFIIILQDEINAELPKKYFFHFKLTNNGESKQI